MELGSKEKNITMPKMCVLNLSLSYRDMVLAIPSNARSSHFENNTIPHTICPYHSVLPSRYAKSLQIQHLHPLRQFRKPLSLNHSLLPIVSAHSVVMLSEVAAIDVLQELLVVRDDDELEVSLMLAGLDDSVQGLSKSLDVVLVEIGGWFIKGDDLRVLLARRL